MFASHDVVSFTNTPMDKAMPVIRERLQNDKTLKNCTKLNVQDIMELCEFILTTTYFTFRCYIYKQKFGTAIGSPVSPILAICIWNSGKKRLLLLHPSHANLHYGKGTLILCSKRLKGAKSRTKQITRTL